MKTYIAGKITGCSDFKERFARMEERLKEQGHVCLNPAILPHGLEQHEYLKICFSMIDICDAICFLSNWRASRGATLEYMYAVALDKMIIFEEELK